MSGGHFDYVQSRFNEPIEEIQKLIDTNDKADENGYKYGFSKKTIKEFKKGKELLEKAQIYLQRIDWLVCSDDGEETFHERLKEELSKGSPNA